MLAEGEEKFVAKAGDTEFRTRLDSLLRYCEITFRHVAVIRVNICNQRAAHINTIHPPSQEFAARVFFPLVLSGSLFVGDYASRIYNLAHNCHSEYFIGISSCF